MNQLRGIYEHFFYVAYKSINKTFRLWGPSLAVTLGGLSLVEFPMSIQRDLIYSIKQKSRDEGNEDRYYKHS